MKPSFALTLDNDSIGLLHRHASGWQQVGTVGMTSDDLAGELQALLAAAAALEPAGVMTKLVLPNSEILYDRVAAAGPTPAQRRAQIAAALDGRTPYDLAELAFDWSGDGDVVAVAAVARETLVEAEAFAAEHGFNPVAFTAMPPADHFAGEPWFGPTGMAADLLGSDEPERDELPLQVRASDAGDAALDTGAEAATTVEAESSEVTPSVPAPDPVTEPATTATEVTAQVEQPAAGAVAATPADTLPAMAESVPLPPAAAAQEAETEPAISSATTDPEPGTVSHETTATAAPSATTRTPATNDGIAVPFSRPDAFFPVADPALDAPPTPPISIDDEDSLTQAWPGEAEIEAPADAGIDATRAALMASLAPAPTALGSAIEPVPAAAPPITAADTTAPLTPDLPHDEQRTIPPPAVIAATTATAGPPSEKVRKALAKAPRTLKGKARKPASRPAGAPTLPASASRPNVPPPTTEAEAMTVFGQRRAPVRGKPRYLGLMLTVGLLVVLALVAFWAARLLEPDPETAAVDQAPVAVAPVDGTARDAARTTTPPPEDRAQNIPGTPADEGETAPTASTDEAAMADAATTPETPPADETTPDEVAEGAPAAATDTAPTTGAEAARQGETLPVTGAEEFALSLPDPAIAMPPAARITTDRMGDAALAVVPVLPEFGALYQFDAAGNIIPSATGVVTPDGIELFAARPPRQPPPNPFITAAEAVPPDVTPPATAEDAPPAETIDPAAPDPAVPTVDAADGAPDVPPAEIFAPDPSITARRPPARPVDAAPVRPPVEEGALPAEIAPVDADAPAGTIAFALRRPVVRPAAIADAAANQQLAAAAEAAAAAAATVPGGFDHLTGLRPAARPASIARQATRAVAAAPTASAGADIDDGEPELPRGAAAPNIPTRAEVAQQATLGRAINLGRLNLIGVFGTANNRRALIRQSSGRVVTVKVGDRLDGGQVTAIGQGELQYLKGRRTIRLELPRS